MIYADAEHENLINETKRVFGEFLKIEPSTYNGRPTYSKFTITISIPLKSREELAKKTLAHGRILPSNTKKLTELDNIVYDKFTNPEFERHLNIPFSHSYYAQFDAS